MLSVAPTRLDSAWPGPTPGSVAFYVTVANDGGVLARGVYVVALAEGKDIGRVDTHDLSPGTPETVSITVPDKFVRLSDSGPDEFSGALRLEVRAANAEPVGWP